MVVFCPLVFLFTRCIPNTLAFRRNLEDPLCSWEFPFKFLMSGVFRRRIQSCRIIIFHFPFWASCWGFFFLLIYRLYCWCPLLLTGCSFPQLLYGSFLWAIACPKRFPFFLGIQNSRRDCSAPASNVLGSLLPAFLFRRSVTKKISWTLFPALLRAYFGSRLSSSFCRGVDDKIEVIEQIAINVLQGFYYRITLSHSDFEKCRTR